jgi:hypothetical protein
MPSKDRLEPAPLPPLAEPVPPWPHEPAALPVGHRLPGFELQGEIEADGIVDDCRTYRAWDLALLRPVTVAEYLPPTLARRGADGEVAPATRELAPRYGAGLDHFIAQTRGLACAGQPNLVQVLHLLLAQGTAYRVMPRYRGQRLQQLRQRMPGPPDEDALRDLLDEQLAALQVLHATDGVHGAVHPGRILVLGDERSLLLAPRTGPATAADPYAPPELQPGGPADQIGPWSDCHALAQVARFCITGLDPLTHPEAARRPLAGWVDTLSDAHRDMRYSPALLQVLDLAATADIARRPQSAAEFRDWLRRAAMATPLRFTEPADAEPSLDLAPPRPDRAAERAVQSVIAALPPRTAPAAPDRIDWPPGQPQVPQHRPHAAAPAPEPEPAPASIRPRAVGAALAGVAALALAAVVAWIVWLPGETTDPVAAAPAPVAPKALVAAAPPVTVSDFNALPAPAAGPVAVPSPAPATPPDIAPAPAPTPATAPASALPPAAPAAKPTRAAPAPARPTLSPRERCGDRTPFSLYRCMQRECAVAAQRQHPQCVELRRTDSVK